MTERNPESPLVLQPAAGPAQDRVQALHRAQTAIREEVALRIVGQEDVIDLLLIALFSRGHSLFVGVPGLAKTRLITTLAEVLSLESKRIQFTPDLMPSDITGTEILEIDQASGQRRFRFSRGPIFTNLLLADEINRSSPKTQAALLQSMAEREVTSGRETYSLEEPYLVFATQNPIEQEGTYPLPEAQLDRFLVQILVSYPSADDEVEIVQRTTAPEEREPKPVLTKAEIIALQDLVPHVPVADHVARHAVALVRGTRPSEASAPEEMRAFVEYGAGPRASQSLVMAAKARAVLQGRFAAEVEDVRALAAPILRHRLVLNFRASAENATPDDLVNHLLRSISPT